MTSGVRIAPLVVFFASVGVPAVALAQGMQIPTTGKGLYEIGCASCHGVEGRGVDLDTVAFDDPLPDFTDCSFAEREPDGDWITVTHQGGASRGFSTSMPAYGEAFTMQQLQLIIDYTRTFCVDERWPRGELNMPRAIVTEKAYPEDEAVYTLGVNTSGAGAVLHEITYEKRFGPRSMWEIEVPFGAREFSATDGWGDVGIGDVAVAVKHTVHHSIDGGSIASIGGEVILPTGRSDQGLGTGTTSFEPFVAYGQLLPSDLFLQLFGAVELSTDTAKVDHEALWRAVLGGSWSQGGFGRTWSPMVEVLGSVELKDRAWVNWSLVPQLQVSLNRRQHVLLNVGVRIPLTGSDARSTQLLMYVLWDWFDGGFLDGW